MRRIIRLLLLLSITFGCAAQNVAAEFIGGREKLDQFVKENMKWPFPRMDYMGIVYVRCTIDEKGEIIDPKVEKGLCRECDEEALRLVKAMPKWMPARKNGKKISSKVIIPIDFSLYDKS